VLEAAVHAFNSVKKYVNTGRLRRQQKESGVEELVIVTGKGIVRLPAIEQLLLFADIDNATIFLAQMSGIAMIANQMSGDDRSGE
jgi:hypothetical protein